MTSYAALNCKKTSFSGNIRPIKYFIEEEASAKSGVAHIPFAFTEDFVIVDDENIPTYKTVVDGEVSFTEQEFKSFIAALYYGSDNNFVNIIFNKLIAEDFYIYEYTSLSPLKGKELSEIGNNKIFAIIEVDPGSGEYMSFTMEDFCDILASGMFEDINYKFAILGQKEEAEDTEEKTETDEGNQEETVEEKEPNVITKVYGTVFEAINKVISLIKRLFTRK